MRRTLAALSLSSLLVAAAAGMQAQVADTDGSSVRWGRYGVLNNQWGAALGHADPASYQRVRVEGSRVVFDFDWRNRTSEDASWVKSFPAIAAGWHYGVPVYPGEPATRGLPVRWNRSPRLSTSVRARRAGASDSDVMNLAWDIWVTPSKPDPGATRPEAPSAEIMVWPWRQNQFPLTLEGSTTTSCHAAVGEKSSGAPILTNIATWRTSWDLYLGCATDGTSVWPVYSFVAREALAEADGTIAATGNLGDFLTFLSVNTRRWTRWRTDWWIAGVEFGSEIIQGAGSWTIDDYHVAP